MRILYAAMKYDYGKREQGYSFEHWNFYDSLAHMDHEIIYFDFMTMYQQMGRVRLNRRLWEMVKSEKPDVLFFVLFGEELEKKVIQRISQGTDTVTLNWFCDDHWRFDNYSRHWAPCFNWVVTTAQSALPKYEAMGYKNVIMSQWGFNHFLYRKVELPLKYDVTFVGQPHGNRRTVINTLREAGINVNVWGQGWETGRLSQEEMIRVFNQSRINLNLSNASSRSWRRPPPHIVSKARASISRGLDRFALGSKLKAWRRAKLEKRLGDTFFPEQIKARNFEIPGCGGFQLTSPAENLKDYFVIGEEIAIFGNMEELIQKVRYYLSNDEERLAIAQAGYIRSIRDHSYERRFHDIFQTIGLA